MLADNSYMHVKPRPSVVLFVSNVTRLASFYRELADMNELHADGDHVVLETEGVELVIHRLAGEPGDIHGHGQVPIREDSYLKFCLPVPSIAAARVRAADLGGSIKAPEFEWQARGFRSCDGNDPEGNVLQVRESAS